DEPRTQSDSSTGETAQQSQNTAETPSEAELSEYIVEDIRVSGLEMPTARFNKLIKTRIGAKFSQQQLEEDKRALLQTKQFIDVTVSTTTKPESPNKIIVNFDLTSRRMMRYIKVIGNRKISKSAILDELGMKRGETRMDPYEVENGKHRIIELYKNKNYNEPNVTILMGDRPEDIGVIYLIDEGIKQKVLKTTFIGNTVASSARLRYLVSTKPGFLYLIGGEFSRERLDEDVTKLLEYYRNLGFFDARIDREYEEGEGYTGLGKENAWITIRYIINEGPRYRIRNFIFEGNRVISSEDLRKKLKVKPNDFYNNADIEYDRITLKYEYQDLGYVRADITPNQVFTDQEGYIDIRYDIKEENRYRVRDILIDYAGKESRTKSTVILNMLDIAPGQLLNGRKIRSSENSLRLSGYFNDKPTEGQIPEIAVIPDKSRPLYIQGANDEAFRKGQIVSDSEVSVPKVASRQPGDNTYQPVDKQNGGNSSYDNVDSQEVEQNLRLQKPESRTETPDTPVETYQNSRFSSDSRFPTPVAPNPAMSQNGQAFTVTASAPATIGPTNEAVPYGSTVCAYNNAEDNARPGTVSHAMNQTAPVIRGQGRQIPTAFNSSTTLATGNANTSVTGAYNSQITTSGSTGVMNNQSIYADTSMYNNYNTTAPPVTGNGITTYQTTDVSQPQTFGSIGQTTNGNANTYSPGIVATSSEPQFVAQNAPGFNPLGSAGVDAVFPGTYQQQMLNNQLNGSGAILPNQEPIYDADALVKIMEGRTGMFQASVGVNSDYGLVGNVSFTERNFDLFRLPTSLCRADGWKDAFRGGGQIFQVQASPGQNVSRYSVSWDVPYIFNTKNTFGVTGLYGDRSYDEWFETRLGGELRVGRQWTPRFSTTLNGSIYQVRISDPAVSFVPDLNDALGRHMMYTVGLNAAYDTRNHPYLPTEGYVLRAHAEQVLGDYSFPRIGYDARYYTTLHKRFDGSGHWVLGLMSTADWTGDNTPIYERYYGGGSMTLRGFEYRGVTPRYSESGFGIGGNFQFINSAELLIPLSGGDEFQFALFVDTGTVASRIDDWGKYRVSPGFGFRVAVPMLGPAPLALDFAFPVTKDKWDDTQVFSFSISGSR
ncbi:MAG: BamA/TamA family outer membrane protein, partial [Thermoguttaceae bacterium]|nr:BamA/TamA family outer membrane protein [Thermoguttaceae bacterium]